jgi:AcrR family transcriptional regulator
MVVRGRYQISELVAKTRVPPATIHHYLRLRLLPAPRREARNRFVYDDRHVQGVQLIRILRERRRLPLRAIGRILPDLLELEGEQAFRPEMWDRAVGLHLRQLSRRAPQARLLEAAKDAFARRGYDEVNVDDICRAARIAKGSLYRHYRSKEELFFAAAEAAAMEAVAALETAAPSGRMSADRGAEALAVAAGPVLPIFLDLVKGTLQRRPGYREAALRVLGLLAERLTAVVPGGDRARVRLVERAVARIVGEIIAEPFEAEAAGHGKQA